VLLELDRVSFAYGPRAVLSDVSFQVGAGELVGVVGGNGAGKSTLLRVAAGLLAPAAGGVRVGGDDPRRLARRALARRLAYLPQEYTLAFPFTVHEVVLMGRYPHAGALALDRPEDLAAAQAAMERCDVASLAARRFDELSGGERRRALVAQAFCQGAEIVLLDEPTASLDPAHALAVFRVLGEEQRARGAAAVVVTHDLHLAARHADRLVLLDGGRVTAAGPPEEVLASEAARAAFGVRLHVGRVEGSLVVVPLS
jgi:iron complex transport system ATP-binding protein